MNWKFSSIDTTNQISLHDSVISAASWDDNSLTLSFENGFTLTPLLEQNTLCRLAQTSYSEICFPHCTDFSLRVLTSRKLNIFGRTILLGRRWYELTEETGECFSAFIAKYQPAIIAEYHTNGQTAHHYTCFAPSLNRHYSFLTLVRLNDQKLWRPLFGFKAYDRFETKHWNDGYDIKEISVSSFSQLFLSVSSDSQASNIIYRWNDFASYE